MEKDNLVDRTISTMQPGEHACCICTGDMQYRQVLSRYVSAGLKAGQKVLLLHDDRTPDGMTAALREAGLDPEPALRAGQLAFRPCLEVFGLPERFDPTQALAAARALADTATIAGYPAMRAVLEMSWAARFLPDSPGASRLADFELLLSEPGSVGSHLFLCIYDQRVFSAGLLAEILPAHPYTSDGCSLERNSAYLPPVLYYARQRERSRFALQSQALLPRSDGPPVELSWGKRVRQKTGSLAGALPAPLEHMNRYKAMFDFATDAIFIHDMDGHILEVNAAACQRLNYTAGELLGKTPDFIDAPELAEQFPIRIHLLRRFGTLSFETVHVSRLGELIPVEVNARLIDYGGQTGVLSIARDITDRKLAEVAQINTNQALASANDALARANEALASTNAALSESEHKFRSLTESSPDGVFLVDESGHIIEFNPASEVVYGMPAARMEGKLLVDFYYDSQPPELRQEYLYAPIQRDVNQALETGKADWLERIIEREICRPDGHRRFIQSIGFPIQTERGWMIGVITRDVTDHRRAELELEQYRQRLEQMVADRTAQLQHEIHERQQAEENLQVMLREIHHRVKNNLSIIVALIDLQKGAHSDPQVLQVFKELQTRAYTMALVHESLYRSPNLAKVDFSGYLRTLVAYLNAAYGSGGRGVPVSARVEAQEVLLKIETAIPCGLIVNELVTNALKYAFPADSSIPAGEILVSLTGAAQDCGPDGTGEHSYLLTVRDNGVGLAPGLDWQSLSTLGLQLVQVLTRQLGGQIELDAERGTTWQLSFAEHRG